MSTEDTRNEIKKVQFLIALEGRKRVEEKDCSMFVCHTFTNLWLRQLNQNIFLPFVLVLVRGRRFYDQVQRVEDWMMLRHATSTLWQTIPSNELNGIRVNQISKKERWIKRSSKIHSILERVSHVKFIFHNQEIILFIFLFFHHFFCLRFFFLLSLLQ